MWTIRLSSHATWVGLNILILARLIASPLQVRLDSLSHARRNNPF